MRAKPWAAGVGRIITIRNPVRWEWRSLRIERKDVRDILTGVGQGYDSSLREDGKIEFYEVGKPRKIYASEDAWRVAMMMREIEVKDE